MLFKMTGLTFIDLPILHPFSLPVYIPHLVAESLFYILSVLRILSWQREGGAAKRSRFTRYTCLVKVIICVMIVWVLGPQESSVTPGNAVASFISVSDSYTADRLELLVKHPKHKADSGSSSKMIILHFALGIDIHIRLFRCLHPGRSWRSREGISNDKQWRDVSSYPRLSHA